MNTTYTAQRSFSFSLIKIENNYNELFNFFDFDLGWGDISTTMQGDIVQPGTLHSRWLLKQMKNMF